MRFQNHFEPCYLCVSFQATRAEAYWHTVGGIACWCITPQHTCLGRKPHELINIPAAKKNGIQVIKRFSGGGTVVTDEDTIFATLIMQSAAVPDVELYPRPLMRWSEQLYKHVFVPYGPFNLQENGKQVLCSVHCMVCGIA